MPLQKDRKLPKSRRCEQPLGNSLIANEYSRFQRQWHSCDCPGHGSRTGASNFSQLQRGSRVSRVIGSSLAFSGQTDGTGLVGAKKIQGCAAQEGDVLSGITRADQAGILAKDDVKAPMQAVLDTPMGPRSMRDSEAVGVDRGDDVAFLGFNATGDLPRRFDVGDRGELRPAIRANPVRRQRCNDASRFGRGPYPKSLSVAATLRKTYCTDTSKPDWQQSSAGLMW